MNRRVLYPAGTFFIILFCLVFAFFAWNFNPANLLPSDHGIAFPSPDIFPISTAWGRLINDFLLFACGASLYFLNKHFSLLRTDQPLGAAFLLPLLFATLPLSEHLSSTPFVLLIALLILAIFFGEFRAKNATRQIFAIATFLSVGSMFQTAFIPLTCASFLVAFVMEIMRPKEFLAMGMGLISPYWVMIGLGIVNPLSLRFPPLHTVFSGNIPPQLFLLIVTSGVLALSASLLSIYNGMILYAGNSRVRRAIISINIFGITAFVAMMLDIDNIGAYLGVFYLWIATQLANLFSLRDMRRGMLAFWLIQLIIYSLAFFFLFNI